MFNWELFAIPQAFVGINGIRQTNAIKSWSLLSPQPRITLFCDDLGVEEVARRYGSWAPDIARNSYGTPLVGNAFMSMQERTTGYILCYVNSDIILTQDFVSALEKVQVEFDQFLMIGQRWDVDINERIDFSGEWEERLNIIIGEQGKLHRPGGMDYFVFRGGLFTEFPPFAVGRVRWDNWVMSTVVTRGIPTIDVSPVSTVIHQNLPAPGLLASKPDSDEDRQYIPTYNHLKGKVAGNITDSTWILEDDGFRRR